MPKNCCVTYCHNNNLKNPDKSYYQIPTDPSKRGRWLRAINRVATTPDGRVIPGKLWAPNSVWTYVCSDHFIKGERSLVTSDPDYVPSIFPKKPLSSTASKSPKAKKYRTVASPHRQKLERHQRKVLRQSKTKNKEMSRRLRLQSPDFQPTSPIRMPEQSQAVPNINEENEGISDDIKMPDENEAKCDHSSHKNDLHSEELKRIYEEMNNLRLERDQLKKENEELKHSMASSGLRYQAINDDEAKCLLLTGLKPKVLKSVIDYLKKARSPSQKPPKHSMEDQILLTIIKLKHNLVFELLALIFGVSLTTTIDYFWSWIDIMYINLKRLIKMQDRDNIFRTIPAHFKCKFPRLTSIIDCFEVFVEAPSSLLARAQFYSQYKKHTTIKVFISCTPLGAINYVSQCYGGRASDVQVVKESGFHTSKFHMPGDQILADRGFTLVEEFAAGSSTELLIPAFTKGKTQLSAKEVEVSHKIASVRIHIERVIGLLRNRYTILKGIIPLRLIKSIKDENSSSIIANCDKLVVVCSALTNLNASIVFDKDKPLPNTRLISDTL